MTTSLLIRTTLAAISRSLDEIAETSVATTAYSPLQSVGISIKT
ncbi:MAG: hypothetical protein ACREBD_33340 [Blastocatellia bacterium]